MQIRRPNSSHRDHQIGHGTAKEELLLDRDYADLELCSGQGSENRQWAQNCRVQPRQPFFGRFRLCVALLLALALYCSTSMRMNLGMAIVCMVNSTAVHQRERMSRDWNASLLSSVRHTSDALMDEQCAAAKAMDSAVLMGYQGTLEWTSGQQARLFGATFYGSLLTVWLSGYLADRFGPKFSMAFAIADYTLISLLTPWLVSIGYNAFFVARLFMGLGESLVVPTMTSMGARWFPPAERSSSCAIYTLGNQIAALMALLLSSRLCALDLLGGWPTIFVTFGASGLVVLALWMVFAADSPKESRWVGSEERSKIVCLLDEESAHGSKRISGAVPWRQMAASAPLVAGIVGQMNFTFTHTFIQAYLPTYMKEAVRLDLNSNGLFSVIPFVAMMISKICCGFLADYLRKRGILTVTGTVKLFQCIATLGSALAMVGLAFLVDCRVPWLAALLMALFGTCFGASTSGFFTQLLSIAPRFSGTISSMGTSMGLVGGGVAPIVMAAVNKHGSRVEWATMWTIVAAVNCISAAIFLVLLLPNSKSGPSGRVGKLEQANPATTATLRVLANKKE